MQWTVSQLEAGLTVDDWLRARLPHVPTGYLRQLISSGRVRNGDGRSLSFREELTAGALVMLPDSQRLLELIAARERLPDILRETDHWVIAFKPAGLAVHLGKGHEQDNLTERLQCYYRQRGAPFRVSPVHRLDLGTSGPVLFGKGRQATGVLGKTFMTGRTIKQYLALAEGRLADRGTLDSPIIVNGKEKPSWTHYRTIRRWDDCSLLFLTLGSGRQHQIRRQLAKAGHPLIGDRRYAGRSAQNLSHPFLHHCRLVFFDPWREEDISTTSPLPPELSCLLLDRRALL